ncbi:hypothetical protein BH11ACT6_BH11ACT6_29760 [soil metagenome]
MQIDQWLTAVDQHPDTFDTDLVIAAIIAQEPDRLWSLSDLFQELHQEHEPSDVWATFIELLSDGFIREVVALDCSEHTGNAGDDCWDFPCGGDSLFRIRYPQ